MTQRGDGPGGAEGQHLGGGRQRCQRAGRQDGGETEDLPEEAQREGQEKQG